MRERAAAVRPWVHGRLEQFRAWRSRTKPRSPLRVAAACVLVACLAWAVVVALGSLFASREEPEGILDPETVSFDAMMRVYQGSKEYMKASRWHLEDGTFVPSKKGKGHARGRLGRLVRFVGRTTWHTTTLPIKVALWAPRRLLRRHPAWLGAHEPHEEASNATEGSSPAPAPLWHSHKAPKKLVDTQRSMARVPRKRSCGADGVQELHHISTVMPGIDPVYLMELLTSPAYGVGWNPSVRNIVTRQHRYARRDAVLPEVFSKDALKMGFGSAPQKLLMGSKDKIDLVAQVTEMPVPRILQSISGGRRFTADFIGARFDCAARRGFTLATSFGTEVVAEHAGVHKGQELCLSAMMVAPHEGREWNGTKLHIVTHFDPQVPSGVRKLVHASVGRSLTAMMAALHRRALQAQATGKHPYVDCP